MPTSPFSPEAFSAQSQAEATRFAHQKPDIGWAVETMCRMNVAPHPFIAAAAFRAEEDTGEWLANPMLWHFRAIGCDLAGSILSTLQKIAPEIGGLFWRRFCFDADQAPFELCDEIDAKPVCLRAS